MTGLLRRASPREGGEKTSLEISNADPRASGIGKRQGAVPLLGSFGGSILQHLGLGLLDSRAEER